MFVLLAAAMVAATPPAALPYPQSPTACDRWNATPVRRAPADGRAAHNLGKEPAADLHLLVLRRDSRGCSVPVIVRYRVEGDGRFAKSGPD
jgi:hypothetical protein